MENRPCSSERVDSPVWRLTTVHFFNRLPRRAFRVPVIFAWEKAVTARVSSSSINHIFFMVGLVFFEGSHLLQHKNKMTMSCSARCNNQYGSSLFDEYLPVKTPVLS